MDTLKSSFNNITDYVKEHKLMVSFNLIGFGAIGYYMYKKYQSQKDDELLILNKVKLESRQFSQTYDPLSVKTHKKRSNARRVSMLVKQDSKVFKSSLKIPSDYKTDSQLVEELRYMDEPTYNLQRVPHLAFDTEVTSYQIIKNPLHSREKQFVGKEEFVVSGANFNNEEEFQQLKKYPRAGAKSEIFFQPQETRALILTCGGLCPGLNSVVREIVMTLWYNYEVKHIFGAKYGYQGIYNPRPWVELNPDVVKNIHTQGGTWLGSSRGGFDLEKILNALIKNKINQLYIIGGDGTHAGIYEIYREVKRRKLKIAVCGIPKTIDNDIPIIDSSFGYQTALEEAQRAIKTAWVESHSHEYGIGIVKLMGRQAGWIAMGASYAARNVNICLIPEFQFDLYGEQGLLNFIYSRLNRGKFVVMVVAEGAIEGCRDLKLEYKGHDKSGNPILPDIGQAIKKEVQKYCSEKGMPITLKYIDPSYMIRSVPPNAQDQKICSYVAQNAVHGCMFGFTGFSNGIVNGKNCLISLSDLLAKEEVKNVPADFRMWRRFLISSGQPNFLNDEVVKN